MATSTTLLYKSVIRPSGIMTLTMTRQLVPEISNTVSLYFVHQNMLVPAQYTQIWVMGGTGFSHQTLRTYCVGRFAIDRRRLNNCPDKVFLVGDIKGRKGHHVLG